MLIQSDLSKWRLSHLVKLDNLYTNSESTRLIQIYQNDFIEYNNKKFQINSHKNLI